MKQITRFKSLLLLSLFAVAGAVAVQAQTIYKKVKSLDEVESGKKYLLVNEDETKNYISGDLVQKGTKKNKYYIINGVTVTIQNEQLDVKDLNLTPLTITCNADRTVWYIYNGSQYYGKSNDSKNDIATYSNNTEKEAQWTLEFVNNFAKFENIRYTNRSIRSYYVNTNDQRFAGYNTSTVTFLPALYKQVEAAEETEEVAVTSAGYATYFTDASLKVPAGVNAYTAKLEGRNVLPSVTFAEGDIIAAQTAFMIQAAEGTYSFTRTSETGTTDNNNILKGSLTEEETTGGTYFYKLANGEDGIGFYWANENGAAFTNGAKRAYIATDAPVNVRGLFDKTTGVKVAPIASQSSQVFDLYGRRVSTVEKGGIYIVNGKKVIK